MFIELTSNGKKFIGNVNLLQRVFLNDTGKTCVVGWNNNGYFEVDETYEEVIEKLDNRMFKTLRIHD